MADSTKTALYFILTFIGLGLALTIFSTKAIPSFLISLLLSIFFYYDPKKIKERNEVTSKKSNKKTSKA